MSFTFDEQDKNTFERSESNKNSGLIGFLIKKGIVQDEKNAEILLAIIAFVCLLCMATIIYMKFYSRSSVPPPSPEQKKQYDANIYKMDNFNQTK